MKRIFGFLQAAVFATVMALLALLPIMSLPVGAGAQNRSTVLKNIQVPFASAARTASVNSSTFDVYDHDVLVCFLSVTANSGTTPTLDVKFQDSPDGGTTWFDVAFNWQSVKGLFWAQKPGSTLRFYGIACTGDWMSSCISW